MYTKTSIKTGHKIQNTHIFIHFRNEYIIYMNKVKAGMHDCSHYNAGQLKHGRGVYVYMRNCKYMYYASSAPDCSPECCATLICTQYFFDFAIIINTLSIF